MVIDFLLGKKTDGILNTLAEIRTSLVDLDIVYTEPEEIDWTSITSKVGDKEYTQMSPGIYARSISGPEDIQYKEEKKYHKEIQSLNFKSSAVIFTLFSKGAFFPPHYHTTKEVIKCLEGSFIGADNKVFIAGETQVIAPKKPHIFKGVTDGMCIVTINK